MYTCNETIAPELSHHYVIHVKIDCQFIVTCGCILIKVVKSVIAMYTHTESSTTLYIKALSKLHIKAFHLTSNQFSHHQFLGDFGDHVHLTANVLLKDVVMFQK